MTATIGCMLLVAVLLLLGWVTRPGRQHGDWAKVLEYLGRLEESFRAGALGIGPPAAEAGGSAGLVADVGRAVAAQVEAAQAAGVAPRAGLVAARQELRLCRQQAVAGQRLWRVVFLRAAIGLGTVVVVRLGMATGWGAGYAEPPATNWALELGASALAAALLVAGCLLLRRGLPVVWSGEAAVAPSWLAWLGAYLEQEPDAGTLQVAVPGLEHLHERELALGVSLKEEKRLLLEEWAQGQRAATAARLQLVEEMLPVGELACIGLPVGLLLLGAVLN